MDPIIELISTKPTVFISGYGSAGVDPKGFTKLGTFDMDKWMSENKNQMTTGGLEKLPSTVSIPGFTESLSNDLTSLQLPTGVVVVFGRTGSGKSEFINYLSDVLSQDIIRFYEPELPVLLDPENVIARIEDFLVDGNQKVFLLDSLRFWIFRDQSKSSALKGGMNSGLFIDITALSALAAYYGKTIVAVINPMSEDDSVIATMAHNLEGSCAGVVQARSYGEISFVARTAANNRKKVSYTYNPSSGRSTGDTSVSDESLALKFGGDKTPDAVARWNRVMNRKDI